MIRCYRCGTGIMRHERCAALVGGTSVNMHRSCKEEHDREQEALSDEEVQGTANVAPAPAQQDETQASAEAEA